MSRQLIAKICQENSIDLKILSRGWLFRLEKNDQTRYMFRNYLSLNSQSSSAIAADKFATFEVLRAAGIPVIDHAIIYPFDNHHDFAEGCNTATYLENYFNSHQKNIVIKPNHGQGGQGISHVTSSDQLPAALETAFAFSESASLCPFYHIRREYRVIMLDGEPRLVYGKERGADWRFNLQNGATSVDVADPLLRDRLFAIAKRAAKELDLRLCSVDIIELDNTSSTLPSSTSPSHPSISSTTANHSSSQIPNPSLLVIEVNSTVSTTHYLKQHPNQTPLVEAIYLDVIQKIFE